MKLRLAYLLLAVLLVLGMFAGCGARAKNTAAYDKMDVPASGMDADAPMYADKTMTESATVTNGMTSDNSLQLGTVDPAQKMVYSVFYQIQTLAFDDSVAALNVLTAELGGYVENSRVSGSASGNYRDMRHATYTLRIPAANLQAFLDRVGTVGTVVSESLNGRDVTLEYVDTESRLKALRAQEARIIELLAEATDLQYVLDIERELSNIRYQIESYTSQLNRLNSLISYSTVEVTLSEVYQVVEPKSEPQSFGDKLAATFSASIDRIWDGLQSAAIWFLGNIVELVLWTVGLGACVFVIVVLVKKAVRKRRLPPPDAQ